MLRPLTALSFVFLAVPALAAPQPATVTSVVTKAHPAGAQLRIALDAAPIFSTRGQATPPKLIIDLPGTKAATQTINAPNKLVKSIAVDDGKSPVGSATRIVVAFTTEVTYDVHTVGKTLVVTLNDPAKLAALSMKPSGKAVKVAALTPPPAASTRADFGGSHRGIRLAQDEGAAGAGTDDDEEFEEEAEEGASAGVAMTYVGFRDNTSVSQVFARLNKRNAKYKVKREGDNLLVLEIEDASIPLRNNRNHLDATFFDSPVKMVTPTEVTSSTPKIRIVIEMKSDVPYQDTRDGVDIVLSFRK